MSASSVAHEELSRHVVTAAARSYVSEQQMAVLQASLAASKLEVMLLAFPVGAYACAVAAPVLSRTSMCAARLLAGRQSCRAGGGQEQAPARHSRLPMGSLAARTLMRLRVGCSNRAHMRNEMDLGACVSCCILAVHRDAGSR